MAFMCTLILCHLNGFVKVFHRYRPTWNWYFLMLLRKRSRRRPPKPHQLKETNLFRMLIRWISCLFGCFRCFLIYGCFQQLKDSSSSVFCVPTLCLIYDQSLQCCHNFGQHVSPSSDASLTLQWCSSAY